MKCQKCKKYIEFGRVGQNGKLLCGGCFEAERNQKKKPRKKKK